jgi:hypothetical protein
VFWILLGLVLGFGALHWAAGAIAGVVGIGLVYYCKISLTTYACNDCLAVLSFDAVVKK